MDPGSDPVGLFEGVLSRGRVAQLVSDEAWVSAILEVEAALARAEARTGIVAAEDADRIAAACRDGQFEIAAIARAAAASGNLVVPIVARLREIVARDTEVAGDPATGRRAAAAVHLGATSQDILDTAAMLIAGRAIDAIVDDLAYAGDAAAVLARDNRATLIAGRTLLQHALPTTFGAKAAGWLVGIDAAAERLREVRRDRVAVQLGGAVGTLAALMERADGAQLALDVVRDLAAELGLAEPRIPWHSERTRIAELAGALGECAVAVAKAALDLVLLAQPEVAEVGDRDAGRGRSSTLPQKHNPVAAIAARACAAQAPGLVATLLTAAGAGEHERAAGAWHAEWRPLTELLRSVGSAAAWLRDALEHAVVDAGRMRANAGLTGGALLGERVVQALAPSLGFGQATEAVRSAVNEAAGTGRTFPDVLAEHPGVSAHLDRPTIDRLLDPDSYLGAAGVFVDRAIADHIASSSRRPASAAAHDDHTNGTVRLHHVVEGPPRAPVLLLIHSLGTTLDVWQPQVAALRDRFRIVRCDLRGHGESPAPPGPYTIAGLAADVVALLDALGIERAHICGLSIGGMVAIWLAAHVPDRVDRLMLCATSAKLGPPERWSGRVRQVESAGMSAIAGPVVDLWLTAAFSAEHPELVADLARGLVATNAVGYVGCCSAIETMDLTADLAAIHAPTLVIAGADDMSITLDHCERLAEGIDGARLEIVPDAAHLVTLEQPAVVSGLIDEHCSSTLGARR